jgi:hypothetical protein
MRGSPANEEVELPSLRNLARSLVILVGYCVDKTYEEMQHFLAAFL